MLAMSYIFSIIHLASFVGSSFTSYVLARGLKKLSTYNLEVHPIKTM